MSFRMVRWILGTTLPLMTAWFLLKTLRENYERNMRRIDEDRERREEDERSYERVKVQRFVGETAGWDQELDRRTTRIEGDDRDVLLDFTIPQGPDGRLE